MRLNYLFKNKKLTKNISQDQRVQKLQPFCSGYLVYGLVLFLIHSVLFVQIVTLPVTLCTNGQLIITVTPLVSVRKTACYLLRAEVFVQREMSHGRVNPFLWHASPSSFSQECDEICFRIEQRFAGLSVMCLATILIDDPSDFHCFSSPHLPLKNPDLFFPVQVWQIFCGVLETFLYWSEGSVFRVEIVIIGKTLK